MSDLLFVYITAPDLEVAKTIARALVEERLAACANILPLGESLYHWQGKVEEAREVALILKTQAVLFDKLAARCRELHPYDCPCIVGLPLAAGTSEYLSWIRAETNAPL